MRALAIGIAVALCLAGCGKHPTGRYTAVPIPGAWSGFGDHFNAKGVRFAQISEGGRTRWYFVHLDGSREPIANLPDSAIVADINDHNMLTGSVPVGDCSGDNCARHAFIWKNGTLQDLGTFGGTSSSGHAINNQGDVAGSFERASNPPLRCTSGDPEHHAFLYSGGKFIELTGPAGYCGLASNLNDAGDVMVHFDREGPGGKWQVVREVYGQGNVKFRVDGKDIFFDHIGASGDAVGFSNKPDGYAAALFHDGKPELLDQTDNWRSEANWTNDAGVAVGSANIGPAHEGTAHAVLFQDNKVIDLNTLIDWSADDRAKHLLVTNAHSVSNQGDILCRVVDSSGNKVGLYVLRPENGN